MNDKYKKEKNILIIDDHKLIYEGLLLHLKKLSNRFNFLYAENFYQVNKILSGSTVDSAVIDISLKNESGFDIAEKIKNRVKYIFFLSMHRQAFHINRAYSNYNGYFLKDSSADIIAEALDNPEGRNFWCEKEVLEIAEYMKTDNPGEIDLYNSLSHREQEIFILLAEGLNYKSIAKKLFISPKTASAHRYNIMQKLHLKDQTELIKYAVSLKLIDL